MDKLTLEFNENYVKVANKASESLLMGGRVMITPAVGDDDYWVFRVRLTDEQAIIAFPKFFTLGIGFLKEDDWNTNLPYQCDVDKIYNHIKHNKGDKAIAGASVKKAIKMIKDAIETGLSPEDIRHLNGG